MSTSKGPTFRRRAGLAAAAVLAAILAGCGGSGGRAPLVLYSPHGRDLLVLFEKTYEAQNPTVDVQWLDMGSQEVYDRVRTEKANPQGDVFFGGPASILQRAAAEDLLEPYRPAWADQIAASGRDGQDRFFALYRTPPILVYNEKALPAEEAPQDWDDLLDPRFAGKVLVREPVASGTMRTIFGFILARSQAQTGSTDAGFEWLKKLDGQTKEYVSNPALLHLKMERQEGIVTAWELTDILFQRKRGAPLAYVFPKSGSPVIADSVGLIKGARHAEEAKKFLDWVGSREIQVLAAKELFRLPARQDIPAEELPDWAREATSKLVEAELDWAFLAAHQNEWMQTWDKTVRGRGK
jgi:iron(III) transport system substrate-binding protein